MAVTAAETKSAKLPLAMEQAPEQPAEIPPIPEAPPEVEAEGTELPPFSIDLRPRIINLPDIRMKTEIDVRYPLLPPYATAHIYWDDTQKELVYNVEESQLTDTEKELLKLLQLGLEEMINISFSYASKSNLILKYLEKNVQSILLELGAKISKKSYLKIMYYLYRDFIGLNEIEPLMNDPFIEDLECNGAEGPLYLVHRKYQNMRSNVQFQDVKRLVDFVEKLAQKTGRYVSFAKPLLDGTLPDGSLDYNEPVIFKENGKIKVAKIGAFVDRFYTTDSKEPVQVSEIEVPCFDKDMKIQWKPAQYVYRHTLKNEEKLYKLTLETGREVTLTGAHSIFLLKQTGVVPTRTEELKQDDFVSIPLKLPHNKEIKEINLAEEISKTKRNNRISEAVFNTTPELQREFLQSLRQEFKGSISKDLLSDILYLSLFLNNIASMHYKVHHPQRLNKKLKYPYSIPIQIFNPLKETHYRLRNERISRERMKSILNELRYQRFLKLKEVPEKFLKEWEKRSFVKQGELTDKGRKLIEEVNTVRKLINSDIGFVKVKKIEKVDSSSKYVYDFSVKENENFVGGTGGVICHNSRVNATYTSDVTTHGPTFTIRKFTKEPLTPIHLLGYGTATPEIFAFFWLAVEHKFNVMVIGETASGKTTFLNAILQFVPSEARIVSIEDTRELSLAHENWVPSVSRSGFGIPNILGQQYGEVTLFDLLKETFRQNPDYVVVGEVRGKETYVLFQGMASIPGDQKVMILKSGKPQLIRIDQINSVENCKAICYDSKTFEAKILPIAGHIRHPARKELVKITTKTGREIITTPDHSLFTVLQGEMIDVPASMLKKGNKIAIAARIPCGYADVKTLNVNEMLTENVSYYNGATLKVCDFELSGARRAQPHPRAPLTAAVLVAGEPGDAIWQSQMHIWSQAPNCAPSGVARGFTAVKPSCLQNLQNNEIELSDEFLNLLGTYISNGTIENIGLYNKNECLIKALCGRTEGKHVPDFIYGLSKERIGQFLSGLFTGDGYTTSNSFGYTTILKELGQQIQQLLLAYGIVASLYKGRTRQGKDIYELKFYREDDKDEFLKYVNVLGRKPFDRKEKSGFTRKVNDVYVDKIRKIETIMLENAVPVYDLAVPGHENFLSATGIILHNSGHPSFSTFHAASVDTVLRRLETPPINLPASLVNSLNIVCSVVHIKEQRRNIRRVKDVKEIIEVKRQIGEAETNTLFEWNPINDEIIFRGNSYLLQQISKKTGMPIKELEREMLIRAELLKKMQERNVLNHEEVTRTINEYYKDPETVMKRYDIKGETAMKPEDVKERAEEAREKEEKGAAAKKAGKKKAEMKEAEKKQQEKPQPKRASKKK